jgi:NtrC-family two-component system response regulator AlgB
MSTILLLDDDPHILRSLEIMLRTDGHDVWSAPDAESALELLESRPVDIALVDLRLPGMSGLEFLSRLRDRHRDVDAIIITAHGSVETAVTAMKDGAFDYLTKPFSPEQVRHRIAHVERVRALNAEITGLRRRLGETGESPPLVSRSPAMRHVLELARTVSASDATLLITGESGTGKSVLAQHIHEWSPRRDGPFVVADCTSFQESLLESELFGHKRGAFTGAVADKPGKVETAEGGTLLLDEIGELSLPIQGKLLRLVEERTYERLGDPTPESMNARIVAATNRDPEDMVRDGTFREDLFYRLSVVELHIPALRQRPEDLAPLVEHHLGELSRLHGKSIERVDDEVQRFLASYSWPGNVRELRHLLERAVLVCPGRTIRLAHLPPRVLGARDGRPGDEGINSLAEIEEAAIRSALGKGLSLEETARQLGIDPSTLWRKRKKYGL